MAKVNHRSFWGALVRASSAIDLAWRFRQPKRLFLKVPREILLRLGPVPLNPSLAPDERAAGAESKGLLTSLEVTEGGGPRSRRFLDTS
jgi:hypothetical protein